MSRKKERKKNGLDKGSGIKTATQGTAAKTKKKGALPQPWIATHKNTAVLGLQTRVVVADRVSNLGKTTVYRLLGGIAAIGFFCLFRMRGFRGRRRGFRGCCRGFRGCCRRASRCG